MYEKALTTNQRLKTRLEISKQELAMIQDQLQRAQVVWLKLQKPGMVFQEIHLLTEMHCRL